MALPRCALITCDAHMASVCRRTGLHALYGRELFSGRRADVERLTAWLQRLPTTSRSPA